MRPGFRHGSFKVIFESKPAFPLLTQFPTHRRVAPLATPSRRIAANIAKLPQARLG
jgi:hypothetical protein